MLKFSQKEKQIGARIYRKFVKIKRENAKAPLISFKDLDKVLNRGERQLLNKVLSVNPKEYGKHYTNFYGLKPVPKNLVVLENQKYFFGQKVKKIKNIKTQFLPRPVFQAFTKLNQAMNQDIGRRLNVASGYRSAAYQALVLFNWLFECCWNIRKALHRVTLPGCSEHGYPKHQAVDLMPAKGISKGKDFYKTKEYKWLLKNAHRFGFHLSYPAGNKFGVDFEPWHWSYKKLKV